MGQTSNKLVVADMEFGEPYFSSLWGTTQGNVQMAVEWNLSEVVDGYSYHDFPSSETVYLGTEDAKKLRDFLNMMIPIMEELEKK